MPTFVGIYIYPDVEVLDFTGPYEVFSTATRLALRNGQPPPFSTSTIAARKGLVRARAGLVVEVPPPFRDRCALLGSQQTLDPRVGPSFSRRWK